jgi:hypothetical protein
MQLSEDEEKQLQTPGKEMPVLRTFSSDLADAVRNNEMSVIKVAMAEQKRREGEAELASPTSKINLRYIILSIIVLLAGIGGVVFAIRYKANQTPVVTVKDTKIPALIPADATTSIEIGLNADAKPVQLIQTAIKNVTTREGGIVDVYLTNSSSGVKQTITTNDFFTAISSEIPAPLLRSLSPRFMLGVVQNNGGHPFLIFKTNDYETAFANMFTWEKKLFQDFYIPLALKGDQTSFEAPFKDLLVENKDTRVLLSSSAEVVLLYSFIDEHTLVITTDPITFKEVKRRIETAKPQ